MNNILDITYKDKLKHLCDKITKETQERLIQENLNCEVNMINAVARYIIKKKYTNIDAGPSGKYMVDNTTQEIFGVKAYGVIHRGHFYGTLDTINSFYWGGFTAYKQSTELI